MIETTGRAKINTRNPLYFDLFASMTVPVEDHRFMHLMDLTKDEFESTLPSSGGPPQGSLPGASPKDAPP